MSGEKPAVLVLANPMSGGGLAGELVPHLARDLGRLGYPVEVFQSARPGQITARVRRLRGGGEEVGALVVVGGDGTMRETLMGDPSTELPVAMLPTGTANVLASELRLPKAPAETAAMIAAGKTRVVDTGLARQGERTQPFLLFVGSGADSRVVHEVHRLRAGGTLNKLRYFMPIARAVFGYRAVPHWFVLEDGTRLGPFEQVLVTNVKAYGGMWKLPGDIRADDGLFDCIGFRCKTGGQLLRHGILGSLNRLREGDDLVHRQAARVRIEAEGDDVVQIDGDPGGECPVDVEVKPASLRLLVP
jgi:diacylglycerol kinase family enzyme